MEHPTQILNETNSNILDAYRSREITGKFSATVIHFYSFSYGGKDNTWWNGKIFPVTSLKKTPLEKIEGNRASIWTFPAEKEKEMKEMVLHLFPLESTALLKPTFAAYNSQIDRVVLCCTPCTLDMTSWIAKQVQVPSDSYLREDAKNMIQSILSLSKVMWDKGYACDGLDDPQNFIMMDSTVKLLPFEIRKRKNTDNEMMHRIKFSNLIENHLNKRWKDVEVDEFIKLMRDPSASLENLLNLPILLPPEIRMASYLNLWSEDLTANQENLYKSITCYGKWTSTIPSSESVLYSILTYMKGDPNNTICMYCDTAREAHRFSRNTALHYLSHWRRLNLGSYRPKAPFDMVDKKLKKCLPGLLCKIYAITLDPLWKKT